MPEFSARHRIGVCSWSLQPASPTDLAEKMQAADIHHVQLALDPIRTGAWSLAETVSLFAETGISVISGMMAMRGEDYSTLETIRDTGGVRLDQNWPDNLEAAQDNARIAASLGLSLVTFHAGFIPHESDDPLREVMLRRLRDVIDRFETENIRVGFETGQETAETLLQALEDLNRPDVGVNFDPANMILYGMGDPVEALRRLAPRIVQIHIKDARPTDTPGTWGAETPAGRGAVDWNQFFTVVHTSGLRCDLVIEREGGKDRIGDIAAARRLIEQQLTSSD